MAAAAAIGSACTMKSQEAPPLTGPSEFGLSITVSVSPDVLTQDGASQSLVTVTARDPNGAPARSISLRSEIMVGGVRADFGTLSARNLVTDSAGRATLVYTAPTAGTGPGVDTGTIVDILVTPIGTDFGNSAARLASIRLVPPGIIVPPDGLQPRFTVTPQSAADHQNIFFDASTSLAPGNNPIASYSWDFGDGATASGMTATHAFSASGTYAVKLTISDEFGRSASTTQTVFISEGLAPSAAFTFSPSSPLANQIVNFNAAASSATVGRRIVSYAWDFGDGDQKTTGSVTTTHDFLTTGVFRVTLTVTDDAGHSGSTTNTVTIGSFSAPTANFTVSPTDPVPTQSVNFNASSSQATVGRVITTYSWDFGDGTPIVTGASPLTSHPYATENTFTVTLTVTDDLGKTGSKSQTVSVKFPS